MNTNRLLAFIFDLFISSAIFKILNSLVPLQFYINEYVILGVTFKLSFSLILFIFLIYLLVFDITNNGKTLGKKIMKLEVLDDNNNLGDTKSLMFRTLYKFISLLVLPISVLVFIFNKQYILQDKLSKLRVKNQI